MEFKINGKFGKVCSPDITRPALASVAVYPTEGPGDSTGWILATDGHILAGREIEGDGIAEARIPATALVNGKKSETLIQTADGWHNLSKGKITPGIKDESPMPDVAQVIPMDLGGYTRVGINAAWLLTLARAINDADGPHADVLELFIPPATSRSADSTDPDRVVQTAIAVLPMHSNHLRAFGLIMPVRAERTETEYKESAAAMLGCRKDTIPA